MTKAVDHARYDGKKAVIMMVRTGNWGPWNEEELSINKDFLGSLDLGHVISPGEISSEKK